MGTIQKTHGVIETGRLLCRCRVRIAGGELPTVPIPERYRAAVARLPDLPLCARCGEYQVAGTNRGRSAYCAACRAIVRRERKEASNV